MTIVTQKYHGNPDISAFHIIYYDTSTGCGLFTYITPAKLVDTKLFLLVSKFAQRYRILTDGAVNDQRIFADVILERSPIKFNKFIE